MTTSTVVEWGAQLSCGDEGCSPRCGDDGAVVAVWLQSPLNQRTRGPRINDHATRWATRVVSTTTTEWVAIA